MNTTEYIVTFQTPNGEATIVIKAKSYADAVVDFPTWIQVVKKSSA